MMPGSQPIGVFDSGYGGLTVLREIASLLPEHDFLYMGDNARSPYGGRSFETVYRYTLSCIEWFFGMGCPLVVVACNTASAKALRTIQQHDLPGMDPTKRVLGVIRPTTEIIGKYTRSGEVGILATSGTVASDSYPIEIARFFPGVRVYQQACPLWVPLIENNEHLGPGADYFVREYIERLMTQSGTIDTVLLACTHYPLLIEKIRKYIPPSIEIVSQGEIVARSLVDYLARHPEMEARCSKDGRIAFYTTDSTQDFDNHASIFYGQRVQSVHISI